MKSIILVFLVIASGCSSVLIVPVSKKNSYLSDNAPLNETARPGFVKYSLAGHDGVVAMRRKDAYSQMKELCGGDYEIISEHQKLIPYLVFFESEYNYINFKCSN